MVFVDILKFILFIIFSLSWASEIPNKLRVYREDKNFLNLFNFIGRIILSIASLILAIGVFV